MYHNLLQHRTWGNHEWEFKTYLNPKDCFCHSLICCFFQGIFWVEGSPKKLCKRVKHYFGGKDPPTIWLSYLGHGRRSFFIIACRLILIGTSTCYMKLLPWNWKYIRPPNLSRQKHNKLRSIIIQAWIIDGKCGNHKKIMQYKKPKDKKPLLGLWIHA
jgi:hypothetical protein